MTDAERCRCSCGYRCGGPGHCALDAFECLKIDDGKHFVQDCGHDFSGPWHEHVSPEGGSGGSVTCRKCGMTALAHDMRCGP